MALAHHPATPGDRHEAPATNRQATLRCPAQVVPVTPATACRLHIAVALQGFMLWAPVEKLFMSEIGFDAAAVGVMAAAYAAIVPIVEVPSGILADRWSRRGVLIVASIALALCALIGGLSTDVPTYILSALILGVFFAMHSGTLDSSRLRHRAGGDGTATRSSNASVGSG